MPQYGDGNYKTDDLFAYYTVSGKEYRAYALGPSVIVDAKPLVKNEASNMHDYKDKTQVLSNDTSGKNETSEKAKQDSKTQSKIGTFFKSIWAKIKPAFGL